MALVQASGWWGNRTTRDSVGHYRIPVFCVVLTGAALVGCPEPGPKVTVPELVGMMQAQAESAIVEAGLTVGAVTQEGSDTAQTGEVISQYPAAGIHVTPGTAVDFVFAQYVMAGAEETFMLPGSVPLVMVWMPTGSFMMGRYSGEEDSDVSEAPQHQVSVPGFWMGKYELTKQQWTAVMGTTPWSASVWVLNDADSPAVCVSWDDIYQFILALNSLTGKTFRLPSEAEWEYTCRAGTTTRFYWGDNSLGGGPYCWWYYNTMEMADEEYGHVVGQKKFNMFGLYDTSGNVWEWCEDDWHPNYTGAPTDASAWVNWPRSALRVRRGGCWFDFSSACRSACRSHFPSSFAYPYIGFRLAR